MRLAPLGIVVFLAGCDVSMTQQPKYTTYAPSKQWADGTSARPIPDGTVAKGDLAHEQQESTPAPVTEALLVRGKERYDVFCSPCHGLSGYGNGIIVERGFPRPASFHEDRLRGAPPEYFVTAITHGFGRMYSYAQRVPPEDRWAITAYIRALQLSQHATLATAPEAGGQLK